MAGLLGDSWDDPKTLGVLAAAGALASGRPLGQGLLGAVQAYSGLLGEAQDRQTKKAYTDSQIEENRSQAALRQQQVQLGAQKQQQIQGLLQGVLGGNSLPSGQGPSVAGTTPMPSASSLRGVPLEQIAALKAAGGPDLLEVWKTANVPTTLAANSYATLPGAEPTYLPDPSKGVGFRGGRVEALPGFGAIAQLEGQKVGAQEAAKAPYNFQEGYDPATGAPVRRSVASMVRQEGGTGYANEGQMRNQMQGIPQEMADYNRRELAAVTRDLQNPNLDAGSRAQLQQYAQTLQGALPQQSAPSGIQSGPSALQAAQQAAQQARMVGTANADVVRDTSAQTKAKNAGETVTSAQRAIDLLKLGPTGSGIGALADRAAAFVGMDTPGANIASKLDVVAADITKNVPRFEGPQSDKDVAAYKAAAGDVANRELPVERRIAAAEEVQRLQAKAAGISSGGATGSFAGVPADIGGLLQKYGGGR